MRIPVPWSTRWLPLADVAIAVVLACEIELEAWFSSTVPGPHKMVTAVAAVLFAAPVATRRRWPLASLTACAVVAVIQAPLHGNLLVGMTGTLLPPLILSYSVVGRALFHSPNYWQDEAAVFLLVGATFMTSAYVQQQRGHIGIEAFVGLLSPTVNRVRLWLVDVASLLFCAFFAWKSWTLAHEAWVDGQVSNSMWSPPLAVPYVLMATGMTLLCVQILLQIIIPLSGAVRR